MDRTDQMWNGGTQAHNPYYSFELTGSIGKGGNDAHLNLLMQQPPPPPTSTSLQQLQLSHLQQQQKQQQEASQVAALAAYLLSQSQQLSCSMAPALSTIWQHPALYRDAAAAAAAAQSQSQPASSRMLYSDLQLPGNNDLAAAAAAAVPFSSSSDWQQQLQLQQLQWQLAAGSQGLKLSPTQFGHQLPVDFTGSASLASYSSSLQQAACGVPMPESSAFGCSYNSNSSQVGTAAAAAALQLQAAVSAAPALLDLSLSGLSLADRTSHGSLASSLASSSPSRTSSLLKGSSGSLFSSSSSSSSGGSSSPSTSSWSSEAAAAAAAAAAAVECGSIADVCAQQLLLDDDEDEGSVVPNHFCRQEISVALNATATVLLNTLRSLQYASENPQPRRRLYVCGLRECCKAIKAGTALAVLLAPDIQLNSSSSSSYESGFQSFGSPRRNAKSDRVLDGRMREIMCSSGRVPVVFALSRKKIGQVFGSKKRMSAITLLDVGGMEGLLGAVLMLAEEGRQRWTEMQRLAMY